MMRYLILLCLSLAGFCQAQYLVEDFDITENSSEFGMAKIGFTLNDRIEHYRISSCGNPTYAQFPNGENAFKKELTRNMSAYLDSGQYAVNGNFQLIFEVNSNGKMENINVLPKVQNGDMLSKDVEFALRKIKQDWLPATCHGESIPSKIRLKINFGTENFDR